MADGYKPTKYLVAPPESQGKTQEVVLEMSIRVNPTTKTVKHPKYGLFYTHAVLKHGGQTNHKI